MCRNYDVNRISEEFASLAREDCPTGAGWGEYSLLFPRHIGIIMDGNGRWAKQRGLERSAGHREGANTFRRICEYCNDIGIPYVTFYAFSTENWRRSMTEVSAIMDLLRDFLAEADRRREENEIRGMRIRFIGNITGLAQDIVDKITEAENESASKCRTIVNIAVNYGGRDEILRAAKSLAEDVQAGKISPENFTEELFSQRLYTAGQPDADLIIRPSGEYRLSNFLTWQSAYSEYWFSDVLWPDFTSRDLDYAIYDFIHRNRRFGG